MMNEPIVSVANRLSYIMSLRGLNQMDVSKRTKIGVSSLSQYINGKVSPKQDRIYILAKALDVSEAWLMGYDVPMVRVDQENGIGKLDDQTKRVLTYYSALTPEKKDLVVELLKNLQ